MDKLTTKQKLFAEAYLANPNATEAARKAGYKGNDKTLSVVGAENLAKPCIARYVENRIKAEIVSTNEILEGVREIAFNRNERTADRLKAFDMLGNYLAIWSRTQKVEHQGALKLEVEWIDGNG